MSKEDIALAVTAVGVILQAVTVWQNRRRKRRGRHRRE